MYENFSTARNASGLKLANHSCTVSSSLDGLHITSSTPLKFVQKLRFSLKTHHFAKTDF